MWNRADFAELREKVIAQSSDILDRDIDLMKREWNQGVPFNSGMFMGQMAKIWVDASEKYPPQEDEQALPHFMFNTPF